jgi:hypothetical protein
MSSYDPHPGWFADTTNPGLLRWWSGTAWTNITAQVSPNQPPPPGWYEYPGAPGNRLWWNGFGWTRYVQASVVLDPNGTPPGVLSAAPLPEPPDHTAPSER